MLNNGISQVEAETLLREFDRLSAQALDVAMQMSGCALQMATLLKRGEDASITLAAFLTNQFPEIANLNGPGPGSLAQSMCSKDREAAYRELQNLAGVDTLFAKQVALLRAAIETQLMLNSNLCHVEHDHSPAIN